MLRSKRILFIFTSLLLIVAMAVPSFASDIRKMTMTRTQLTMIVGETRTLGVKISPASVEDRDVTWASRDEDVATVDDSGVVTAVGKGSATIVATHSTTGKTTVCYVTVRKEGQDVRVKKLSMSVTSMTVRVDQTRLLWAITEPNDATNQDFTWTSSDNNVATVDIEGTVTGIAPGTTVITAESENGEKATCTVNVPGSYNKEFKTDASVSASTNSGEQLTSEAVRAAVEETARLTTKGTTGTVILKNKSSISPTVLGAAAYSAKKQNRDIMLQFQTLDGDNKLQASLTIDPSQSEDFKTDIKTGVYTKSQKAINVKKYFEKHFSNEIAVIDCSQSGSFGTSVTISAYTSLPANAKVSLYTYDADTKKCTSIDIPYTLNKNGKLTVTTSYGGTIIASNKPLVK